MEKIKKIVLGLVFLGTVGSYAAVVKGQAFMRTSTGVYTCIGSPVYIEKVEGKYAASILEKMNTIMWDLTMIMDAEKFAKTEEQKKMAKEEKRKFATKENIKLVMTFEERRKSGEIKETRCDTEGRFFFEDLTAGSYVVQTIIRPSIKHDQDTTPIYKRVEVKEGHRNQVILYMEGF